MLMIEKLSVSYGAVRALTEVDLEVGGDGVLHGVIGPNGAGKSTLLDAVCGRRRPTAGIVRYRDEDITRRSVAWRRRQGMARSFQRTSIFQDLTVYEQLQLVAQHLCDGRLAHVIAGKHMCRYLSAISPARSSPAPPSGSLREDSAPWGPPTAPQPPRCCSRGFVTPPSSPARSGCTTAGSIACPAIRLQSSAFRSRRRGAVSCQT